QTPSALAIGVFVDQHGVQAAGGILLQVMPQASVDQELVEKLESRISTLAGFTPLLQAGKTLPQIFQDLLGDSGLTILPERQLVRFHCGCSLDKVLGALKMFGVEELHDMIVKDNGAEAICEFCSEVYQAEDHHLHQLIQELADPVANIPTGQLQRYH
ncbi:MAG: Hsp33 family molecular chaperone HslO, partial [Microcoleaceae cyanobacterium]